MKNRILFIILGLLLNYCFAQKSRSFKIRTVAFYNLENLFDIFDNPNKEDEKSPIMGIKNNREKIYKDKLDKLGEVILKIGSEKTNTSPVILGVAEVENKKVLKDLVKTKKLKKKQYEIIHFDSPDKRGIDVALLYQQRYFKPINFETFNPNIYVKNRKINTRDILLVSGYLDNELIHIIVNHWPSRRGGEAKSRPLREKAAYKVLQILEKIKLTDTNPKVIIMGDFNDDPSSSSFKKILNTKSKIKNTLKGEIYNPYESMFKRGYNSLGFRDNINLFDQIMFTSPFLNFDNKNFLDYKMFKSAIFNKLFLTKKTGKYRGYPFRSFSNGKYTGGYSDHYPVYLYLIKEDKK